jgi:hypothetical protein
METRHMSPFYIAIIVFILSTVRSGSRCALMKGVPQFKEQ